MKGKENDIFLYELDSFMLSNYIIGVRYINSSEFMYPQKIVGGFICIWYREKLINY